jgi:phosphocarrier protein NPr
MGGASFTSGNETLVMIDTTVDVINKLGLHARASGKLIELTSRYRSSIQLGKGKELIDGKNIMSLLMLGAGKGTTLRLVIDGQDEDKACEAIQALFAAKFYEAE